MNLVPLALYIAAFVAYAWHFARRTPLVGRTATTILVAAALAHTFIIGMQTMEAGQVPVGGATSAISMFVWLLAVAYLYTEVTTDERAMGVARSSRRGRPASTSGLNTLRSPTMRSPRLRNSHSP